VPWLECVPNVSEGRRADVVEACSSAIREHAALLDVTADPAHHRSVFTFAGTAPALRAAVLALFDAALRHIDLRTHAGAHPRVGAVDVVPFVPLEGATMQDAVDLAVTVAREVAERFHVPVFLYEQASVGRRRLEEIRRGGLSGLAARMSAAEWRPDFGPARPHPTAGVSVIGARAPLIAYNVELGTGQLKVAAAIARAVRESAGGLPALKAIGVPLAHRGTVQVSMNLTDHTTTSLVQAFDAVVREAARIGVPVLASELIGLAPAAALTADVAAHIRLAGFDPDRMILERRLSAAS
jgi:glutamate formiminotransferase